MKLAPPASARPAAQAQVEAAVKAAPAARAPRPADRKPPVLFSRAERVQHTLSRILESSDLPAFSHHIHGLMGLPESDNMSLRRLTNIILNDYGLTVMVMR